MTLHPPRLILGYALVAVTPTLGKVRRLKQVLKGAHQI